MRNRLLTKWLKNQKHSCNFVLMDRQTYPKIVFLGTPDFAVASLKALIDNKWNVVAVVTAPDKPAGRGRQLKASAVKEYALNQAIPVLQPEKLKDAQFIANLKALEADIQVVVAFRMLPEIVWNMPKLGTINVHGSLLPQYRGAAPINWAIINGETHTGVTTFKLQHAIDTGDILLQSSIPILPVDNMGSMYEKLMHLGAQLLINTLEGIINQSIVAIPQQFNNEIKHAPKIFKEDCIIDWSATGIQIINKIRGLSPLPTAYTFINDKSLKIYDARFEPMQALPPCGSFETDQKTFLKFACNDGWIYINELQIEGKKKMLVTDFLRGFQI